MRSENEVSASAISACAAGPLRKKPSTDPACCAHLFQEQEKAGDVAAIVEPVLEPAQEALRFPRVEAVDGLRGMLAQRLDHARDAALDLLDVPVGQGGGDQADDFAVRVRRLLADELQGVGVDEAMVVVRVEVVETRSSVPRCARRHCSGLASEARALVAREREREWSSF